MKMLPQTLIPQDDSRAMDGAPVQPAAPAGEFNHDRERIADMDRRFGVPVPVGARVWFGDDQRGVIIGGTDELAIIRDDQGYQQAETWGTVMVQAGGPAFTASIDRSDRQLPAGLVGLTPDEYRAITDDPYRAAALRALDLMAHVDRIQEKFQSLDSDHAAVVELLSQVEMALGTIADNRTRRILDGEESGVSA
ncbi:MAG: hypothetical protein AAGA29_07835 [Planctomycetota bacterium]